MFSLKKRKKFEILLLREISAVFPGDAHALYEEILEGIRMRSELTLQFFVCILFSVVGFSLGIEVFCSGNQ